MSYGTDTVPVDPPFGKTRDGGLDVVEAVEDVVHVGGAVTPEQGRVLEVGVAQTEGRRVQVGRLDDREPWAAKKFANGP
nr:hypothetical protein [Actinospica acidiphila]